MRQSGVRNRTSPFTAPDSLDTGTGERMVFEGLERSTVYAVMATTGLRLSELRSIRLCDSVLEGPSPYLLLEARNAKNRQSARIPLRTDIASMVALCVGERLRIAQCSAENAGKPVPAMLVPSAPLLTVPKKLILAFKRDLKHAQISERDPRGRVADVHSLRMTFASHLQAAGVPLKTAQTLMRHSEPRLTSNVYGDVALLDVGAALDALPKLCEKDIAQVKEQTLQEGENDLA